MWDFEHLDQIVSIDCLLRALGAGFRIERKCYVGAFGVAFGKGGLRNERAR